IMADPTPAVYLPEAEYLEIHNRSGHAINLKDWKLVVGNREWILPGIKLEPGGYHFFCHGDSYLHYSDKLTFSPVFSTSSVISNEEQAIALYTPGMEVIDALEYSVSWYNGEFKSEGGWSLERTDMQNTCGGREIWKPSTDFSGGTPGRINSVNELVADNDPPFIRQVIYEGESTYLLRFNEVLDKEFFEEVRETILNESEFIHRIDFPGPFYKECRIELDTPAEYKEFGFQNVWKDCSGNISGVPENVIFSSPEIVSACEILISEVLFSPWPGCSEFIELYNSSEKVFSLNDLKLSVSSSNEPASGGKLISKENILFYPGMYLILSRDPTVLGSFYNVPERAGVLQVNDLPALSNSGAKIALFNRGDILVDEFVYTPENHFPLLADMHGVSLERISLEKVPGSSSQWHSASSLAGFATPGYQNSQYVEAGYYEKSLSVEEKLFTPDNDGINDVAVIRIKMEKEGYVAMIRVFDAGGRLRKTLGYNELLGTNDRVFWDGRDDGGGLCESGIYLIHLDAWHLSGKRKVLKETVVLGRR
ncbi:MAG: lamin tail domain-containing protein, partial [Bacteroidales bacterium]|nr:lamin tail domain-containing protein [Bacteroidales bacterium]